MTQGERKKDQAEEDDRQREGVCVCKKERERERLAWNQAWTLMYCQADIVNALVPGICRVRVCSYPPCDSVIDITFLSVSLVGVRLSVRIEIHIRVRGSRAQRDEETDMRFWFHTQQDLGTHYARIGGARSENEVRHER